MAAWSSVAVDGQEVVGLAHRLDVERRLHRAIAVEDRALTWSGLMLPGGGLLPAALTNGSLLTAVSAVALVGRRSVAAFRTLCRTQLGLTQRQ